MTLRPGAPTIPRLADLRAYDAEGVGHVLPARFATRHPCGEAVRAERFAHPATTRCPECVGKIGITVNTPESEAEKRFAWGDR